MSDPGGGLPSNGRIRQLCRPGSNAVYLTSASLLSNLGLWSGPARPKSSHFLELQAWKTERDQVNALVLEDNGKVVELVKVFPPAPASAARP